MLVRQMAAMMDDMAVNEMIQVIIMNAMRARQRGNIPDTLATLSRKQIKKSIIKAARKGNYKVLLHLIGHGVDLPLQYVDVDDNNLLHIVLHSYKRDVDELLHCVKKLVEAGVDVNHLNKYNQTPIFIAACQALYKVVIYLLEHGAEVHHIDKYGYNLLHRILYGYVEYDIGNETDELLDCITKFVEAGADVNDPNEDGQTPIFIATRTGSFKVVQYFLEHGSRVHDIDREEYNLLHRVMWNFNSFLCDSDPDAFSKCISKLVEAGVDVNQLNQDNQPPIFIAASKCQHKTVKCLLNHGAHVKYVDYEGRNILHVVLSNILDVDLIVDSGEQFIYHFSDQCFDVVESLINMKVDVNKPDKLGNTPLFYVVNQVTKADLFSSQKNSILFKLHYNLITSLINARCNVNHQNKEGQTALMYYTRNQADINILKLILPYSDVNLTDNNGDTACSYCVQCHVFNCTHIFKLYSGDVLLSPNNGVKLFHQILACRRLELFNYYMRLQLIVNGVTTEGENMLHLLARVHYDYSQQKFKWLFDKVLDINHPCSKANTPLMVAALLLNSKYLELFIRHPRIDINSQNKQGHTALHLCIIGFAMVKDGLNKRQDNDVVEDYCRHIYPIYMECVDILLAAVGIDVNITDEGGRTVLMMAAMKNDRFLIRKLLNAGAMVNYNGKSAFHHLDIYESVFDLSFKLLASAADNMLLNLPCINGNTLIQATLRFPRCWDPRTAVSFIKYLVGENCCLQSLVTPSIESSYNQIDMIELSSEERDELRKLLYLSGAPENEIVATLNFDKEDTNEESEEVEIVRPLNFQDDPEDRINSRHQEKFMNYCCNISLMSQCRRLIRQKLGLGIKEKVMDLGLPRELNDFLLLNDDLPKDCRIDNIEDGCNDFDVYDGYGGYDIDSVREDYSQYSYQPFTLLTDVQIRQEMGIKERAVH